MGLFSLAQGVVSPAVPFCCPHAHVEDPASSSGRRARGDGLGGRWGRHEGGMTEAGCEVWFQTKTKNRSKRR